MPVSSPLPRIVHIFQYLAYHSSTANLYPGPTPVRFESVLTALLHFEYAARTCARAKPTFCSTRTSLPSPPAGPLARLPGFGDPACGQKYNFPSWPTSPLYWMWHRLQLLIARIGPTSYARHAHSPSQGLLFA